MRAPVIVVLVGLVGLVIAPTAGARLSEKHICKRNHCTTIAASAKVRVFEAFREHRVEMADHEFIELWYRVDFGVWLPTGKVCELANGSGVPEGNNPYVSEAKIAGAYVAFRVTGLASGKYLPPELPEKVERTNVKTCRHTSTPTVEVKAGLILRGDLYFAVTALGTVAWSYYESIYSKEATVDVLLGHSDTTTVVAHGPTIEPSSLALVPGHLYWLEGGVPRTYAVP